MVFNVFFGDSQVQAGSTRRLAGGSSKGNIF